ncbi:MAG: gluconate 2-dehydrogenase subunit 3 family protein [Alphaproteobacteria bacterium]|nr:gluconate 2-dehydrogenase subunit 3 family protein [Alphaproteobacteria bacterium]
MVSAPTLAGAAAIEGALPWAPDVANPPAPAMPGPWRYFTAAEGAAVEAIVDRLIPPDPETAGGKDSGCAVFIDRQLAGPYGRWEGLYLSGPFVPGTAAQGPQSPVTPALHYRQALAALDAHCRAAFNGAVFAQLPETRKDEVLKQLEEGSLDLEGTDGRGFFELLLKDTQEGFFADPIYGGNRDMAAWKMIGFPGARYDYRDWVERHNERYPLPPVGIQNHPGWTR